MVFCRSRRRPAFIACSVVEEIPRSSWAPAFDGFAHSARGRLPEPTRSPDGNPAIGIGPAGDGD